MLGAEIILLVALAVFPLALFASERAAAAVARAARKRREAAAHRVTEHTGG
jgi:hypothetical protein